MLEDLQAENVHSNSTGYPIGSGPMDFRVHQRGNTLSELLTSLCENSGAEMELPDGNLSCRGRD